MKGGLGGMGQSGSVKRKSSKERGQFVQETPTQKSGGLEELRSASMTSSGAWEGAGKGGV